MFVVVCFDNVHCHNPLKLEEEERRKEQRDKRAKTAEETGKPFVETSVKEEHIEQAKEYCRIHGSREFSRAFRFVVAFQEDVTVVSFFFFQDQSQEDKTVRLTRG